MEALRIEGLTKDFGGVQALSDVSLIIEVGERLALIGPNGAGKTTLFNLINGQLTPSTGKLWFLGKEITHTSTHARAQLGQSRSFQITSVFLNLSIIDNTLIALHGKRNSRFELFQSTYAYTELQKRARQILESIGLWEQRDELVKVLSYGEQRRLEIALTLALEPKLLLLDEPSCGLTSAESADITAEVKQLGKEITVVFVAHDLDLVFGIADRIVVLHHGRVIADGKPDEIRSNVKVKEIYLGLKQDARITQNN